MNIEQAVRCHRSFVVAAAVVAFIAGNANAQTAPPTDERIRRVDAYVETLMRADRTPGAAVVIVHGDSVIHLRGYGTDGRGNLVSGTTGFILGSMSKSFTALAIMQLVQQGRIELDAPVQQYLPWFRVRDDAASRAITVRQLLHHTSGIPANAPRAGGDSLTITSHVRALADIDLAGMPGTAHEYASPNYLVLGAIIEAVSGQSYANYVQQSIFARLGMTHSFVREDSALANRLSAGHGYVFGFPVASTLRFESDRLPTAALISSAADLGNFLRAQLNGGQFGGSSVLSPALLRAMHTDGAAADGFTYGFGWRMSTIGGVPAVHHGGIVPNFRGKMVMLPGQGWGVAVLTNASSSLPLPLVPTSHRLADAIAAHMIGAPLDSTPSRHRLFNFALLALALGVVALQVRKLRILHRTSAGASSLRSMPTSAIGRALVLEVAWIAFALFMLPRFIGLTWREQFAAMPDAAWWLAIVLALSAITAATFARALLHRRQ